MNHRVLLVDDEEDFLKACSAVLRRRGYDVTVAPSGEAALLLLEDQRFDVAVLDVKMPGIDGVELFRRISTRWPELPVVLLTGHASYDQAFRTSREGVFDYLSKPADMDALTAVLERAVQVRAAARQAEAPGAAVGRPGAGDVATVDVLLVDDEDDLRTTLARVLARRGMNVTTAATGAAALEAFAAQPFEVVVLDVKLPDADGIDVLRRIKQRSPLTEVILLTGHPSVSIAIEGLRLGAREYFVKPQDPEDLVQAIRVAAVRRHANADDERQRLVDEAFSKSPS